MRFANSVSALQVNPSFEGVVGRAINGGVKVRTNQIGAGAGSNPDSLVSACLLHGTVV